MIRWVYVFIWITFLFACDTASNIKSPNQSYFIKYFGGDGNQTAVDLIVNSDGSFYILGNSRASVDSIQKLFLVKASAIGEVIWQKTYRSDVDLDAKDFLLTSDGNHLVVVANKNLTSGTTDLLINRYALSAKGAVRSDSIVVNNAYGNSVTELSDGGFIAEGYQNLSGQLSELHVRVSNPWGIYQGAPGDFWLPNYSDTTITKSNSYVGVNAIQLDATHFYTFGNTNSIYSTANKDKFWVSYLGSNGSAITTTDNGLFDNGYPSDKTLTRAITAGRGGYLLVGISSTSTNDSLKVAITNPNTFSFDTYGVDKDLVVLGLGKSQAPTPAPNYATAFSAASYNFILTNTYLTATVKSDILLIKLGNDLSPQWTNPVQFGGDGDDTAAAVAELPDGRIMVLGTMQLGNPPAQFKIVLMKLSASGRLGD